MERYLQFTGCLTQRAATVLDVKVIAGLSRIEKAGENYALAAQRQAWLLFGHRDAYLGSTTSCSVLRLSV